MLVEFEHNRLVQTKRNFELFDKKTGFLKTIFDEALTPFWKTFPLLKQLFNAKLVSWLPTYLLYGPGAVGYFPNNYGPGA